MRSISPMDKARNIINSLERDNTIVSMCIITLLQTRRDLRINPFTAGMVSDWIECEGFNSATVNHAIHKLEKMGLLYSIRHNGKTWFCPMIIEDWQQNFWLWYYIPF